MKVILKNILNSIILFLITIGLTTPLYLSMDYLYRFEYPLFVKIIFIPCLISGVILIQYICYKNKSKLNIL